MNSRSVHLKSIFALTVILAVVNPGHAQCIIVIIKHLLKNLNSNKTHILANYVSAPFNCLACTSP